MKRVAIIGLGNFGYYLGKELTERGFDVLGLDVRKDVVQKAKNDIAVAVVADATDKNTLQDLGVDQVDLAVVTIGTNMLASILATFLLKEIGVRDVHAKALSEEHERILRRVGADQILFPEKDLALSLAKRIATPNMLEYLPFIEDYSIFELEPPASFLGKTLRDLDLINRFETQVLAVRDGHSQKVIFIPKADFTIRQGDILILLGSNQAIQRLGKLE
ncbi:trk system potassium uptake protein TrkA [Desulfacinum hydrothermale DSM 13146]|uniref:Trk system potassium uptake protein TrkA n=1 Tax=Desulfacinum hydrothermale DSM 13146 TaxID=1121390 RepID=A0A1W1WWU2_9BACT|nr:TrkA family potassium uptake protein [Desulfacinum hydrothermale]SMC16189.1 trk system potassium uptake protein TrkA [Desulfacinum hydrothermale DSM 13146]